VLGEAGLRKSSKQSHQLEFRIPGVGGVKSRDSSSQESEVAKCETPKIPKQAHQPEFWIPGVGGVKSRDSSSQESRSAEMRNAENPETGTSTGVSDTRSWRSQESRLFITGVPKCRNAKHRKSETGTSTGVSDTGSWRSQELRLFITGVPKCRNVKRRKSRNRHIDRSFGYQELEESRVETLHHRSPEVSKCEIAKALYG
jgi:hypothetical protein